MSEQTRELTGPFEPKSLSRTNTGENIITDINLHQPNIPSLQVSSPKIEQDTVSQTSVNDSQDKLTNMSTDNKNIFQMANLFRNQTNNNSTKKFPNLSLKTGLHVRTNNEENETSLNLAPIPPSSGSFILSPLTPITNISNMLRRPQENSNKSGSTSRSRPISRSVSITSKEI